MSGARSNTTVRGAATLKVLLLLLALMVTGAGLAPAIDDPGDGDDGATQASGSSTGAQVVSKGSAGGDRIVKGNKPGGASRTLVRVTRSSVAAAQKASGVVVGMVNATLATARGGEPLASPETGTPQGGGDNPGSGGSRRLRRPTPDSGSTGPDPGSRNSGGTRTVSSSLRDKNQRAYSSRGAAGDPEPVITILESRSMRMAPHTVHVHATHSGLGGTDHRWQRTKFEWDFGDTGGQTRMTVDPRNGDLVDLNSQQQGFNAAYIYDEPGTYTIRLTMTNEIGQVATVRQDVTILPDIRDERYVDAVNGLDTNDGTSPGTAWQTMDRALADAVSDRTILFRRDQVFEVTTEQEIGRGLSNVLVGAYGTGARPIIRWTGVNDDVILSTDGWNYETENVMVRDLVFETIYDWQTSRVEGLAMQGRMVTVWNCNLTGMEECVDLRSTEGFLSLNCLHGPTRRYSWVVLNSESAVIVGCTGNDSLDERTIRMFPHGDQKVPSKRVNLSWNLFANEGVRHQSVNYATTSFNAWHSSSVEFGHQDNDANIMVFAGNYLESAAGGDPLVIKSASRNLMIKNSVWLMRHEHRAPIALFRAYSDDSFAESVEIYNNTFIHDPSVAFPRYSAPIRLRSAMRVIDFTVGNNLVVGGPQLHKEMYRISDVPDGYVFKSNVLKPVPAQDEWATIEDTKVLFADWITLPFVFNELQIDIDPTDLLAPLYQFPDGHEKADDHCELLPGLFDDYNGVPYPAMGGIEPGAAQKD